MRYDKECGEITVDKLNFAAAAQQQRKRNARYGAGASCVEQRLQQLQGSTTAAAVPVAHLLKAQTIAQAQQHSVIFRSFLTHVVCDEIIPSLGMAHTEMQLVQRKPTCALEAVIAHTSLDTLQGNFALHWAKKALPIVKSYVSRYKKLPEHLLFSLAACLALQREQNLNAQLSDSAQWGENLVQLAGFERVIEQQLHAIQSLGVVDAMAALQ